MNHKYIALTIGPIIDSLLTARKTRELWAASYTFSYLMREITKVLEKQGTTIILPSTNNIDKQNKNGAGLYPDRIILQADISLDAVKITIQPVIQNFIDDIHERISTNTYAKYYDKDNAQLEIENPFTKKDVTDYLLQFFKLYAVEKTFDLAKDKEENIIFKTYSLLDTLELQDRIMPTEAIVDENKNSPYFQSSPKRIFWNKVNHSFLFKDGFIRKKRFDSLPEIATRELSNIDETHYDRIVGEEIEQYQDGDETAKKEDQAESKFMAEIKKHFAEEFKARHKYVAIVHADGDNVSKIIGTVGKLSENLNGDTNKGILKFSKVLLDYARESTEKIVDFGGAPVYMGGDDMLFFAPLTDNKSDKLKTILDLAKDLDDLFVNYFTPYIDEIKTKNKHLQKEGKKEIPIPSMSYGIAITYYKYPLYEARNQSFGLMEHVKNNVKEKNAINVTLLKHSGQNLSFLLKKKQGEVYRLANELINKKIDDSDFLNSFTYKLSTFQTILANIAHDKNRLEHFFKNYFNENYEQNQTFFKKLADLILEMSKESKKTNQKELEQEYFELLYGILRFIHFVRADDKDF